MAESFHMTPEEFRKAGHEMIDWIAQYLETAEKYPVLAQTAPGEVRQSLPDAPPVEGEPWEAIWGDFEDKILPGVTHWQSPHFYAYFPANVSYPAILGELLSAGLGVNGMLWSTSPAATELETHVLDWLVDLLALPAHFKGAGVIQHTASDASLCALLCAREQVLEWAGNESGLTAQKAPICVYTSTQAHSSIEKGVKIAGIGRENLHLIPVDEHLSMDPNALRAAIHEDRAAGRLPAFVSATMGTTSSLAMDPLRAIGEICRDEKLWLHVDGAMAGSALICPEHRAMADGLELADSFCFNPHKWMFTNFDLDAFYVRDPNRLVRTLAIMPEYLKANQTDNVINYRDWHVPLGRRFRALKLWFVLRHYGAQGLQHHLREHIRLAGLLEEWINADERFEMVIPRSLNLVCFRLKGTDELNRALLDRLNAAGLIHLTHTKLNGRIVLRMSIGQTRTAEIHVRTAWDEISTQAKALLADPR